MSRTPRPLGTTHPRDTTGDARTDSATRRRTGPLRAAWILGIAAALAVTASGCSGGSSSSTAREARASTSTTASVATATETTSATPTAESLASRVGSTCDDDRVYVTQGEESVYCDPDEGGTLIWVTAAQHASAQRKAQEAAKKAQAAAEQARKKEAAAKAKAEAAQRAAQQQIKAAEAKAAAQKAAAKKAAEKAAAARSSSGSTSARSLVGSSGNSGGSVYYANCSAVHAAGKSNLTSSDPGYSRKLDRDGDGIACER